MWLRQKQSEWHNGYKRGKRINNNRQRKSLEEDLMSPLDDDMSYVASLNINILWAREIDKNKSFLMGKFTHDVHQKETKVIWPWVTSPLMDA